MLTDDRRLAANSELPPAETQYITSLLAAE